MAQYLSEDLRIRVIGAVEGGMSRNAAARRFGVSIASAVRWMDEYLAPATDAARWAAFGVSICRLFRY